MRAFRPGWAATLLSFLALVVLVSLGTWQVQRLFWKEALIAGIEEGLAAPPVDLADGVPGDYRQVFANGRILAEPRLFFGSLVRNGEGGTLLLGVFEDEAGRQWLVERGWIPEWAVADAKDGRFDVEGDVAFGAITRPVRRSGPFTPDPDLETGRIFAEVPEEVNERFGTTVGDTVLVLRTRLATRSAPTELPLLSAVDADLPNNHLGYVVTWYGLAAALVGVYVAFGLARGREAGT
ncbi:MAG: SURF1 family cytochrome oxidase biogenesis protein [Geminicoccaceae bacterium]